MPGIQWVKFSTNFHTCTLALYSHKKETADKNLAHLSSLVLTNVYTWALNSPMKKTSQQKPGSPFNLCYLYSDIWALPTLEGNSRTKRLTFQSLFKQMLIYGLYYTKSIILTWGKFHDKNQAPLAVSALVSTKLKILFFFFLSNNTITVVKIKQHKSRFVSVPLLQSTWL